jgi:rsbT co-antagonist protein RsbR
MQEREQLVAEVDRLRSRVLELELAAEQERRGAELQRAQEYVRLLVTYTPAAVALFDPEMRYLLVSSRWRRDYGLGEREILGLTHYEVFPEISEHWREIHRRCLAGASEQRDEDPFPRADGQVDWVRWQVFPWHERSGAIGGIMMFTEVINKQKQMQEQLRTQSAALRELSTPIIPIGDDVLVVPLIGTLDEQRSQQMTEQLLGKIADRQTKLCIIDITGVPVVDRQAASSLVRVAQAVRLLGAGVVLTGIRPEVAQALVSLDVDISSITTLRDLQSGIAYAMARG